MILKTRHILTVGLVLVALTGCMSKASVDNAVEGVKVTIEAHNEYNEMADDEKRYLYDFCNGATMDEWKAQDVEGKCVLVFNDNLNEK